MNIKSLSDSIYDWVRKSIPKNVGIIWANENTDTLDRPYVAINITGIQPGNNRDFIRYGVPRGTRFFTLSLNAFGDESLQILLDLETLIRSKPIASGIAYDSSQGVIDLTGLIADTTTVEKRALLDIGFRTNIAKTQKYEPIEVIEVTYGGSQ